MFTTRHYVAIAEVLKANKPREPRSSEPMHDRTIQTVRCDFHHALVDQLANLFSQDNSRFDWDRFLKASGREIGQ